MKFLWFNSHGLLFVVSNLTNTVQPEILAVN